MTLKFLNHRIRERILAEAEVYYVAEGCSSLIGHIMDTANKEIGFVQGLTRENFDNNELLRLSLTHLLQILGEAARRVSLDFRATHPQIDWKAIIGMQSKLVPNCPNKVMCSQPHHSLKQMNGRNE